jgi:hypothetical protein
MIVWRSKRMKYSAGALLFVLVVAGAQAAEVYKWTDEKGRVHFSDRPVPSAKKIEIKPPANTPPDEPSEADAARIARECEARREQLLTYQKAARVIERDSLGNEKEFTEAERQQLIARTQHQIQQYCSGAAGTPAQRQSAGPAPGNFETATEGGEGE